MQMPGRKYSVEGTNYRYGFNGKELDKETSGTSTYDYGFRIYSPGLGRFLSVDPLSKSFPQLTPFQFSSNSPIANVDLDGKESEYYTKTITYTTVHRTENYGRVTRWATSSTTVEHETKTGWIWGLIPNNGPLGTGTLYTVKTKTVEVFEGGMGGLDILIEPKVSKPKIIGLAYKFSESDEKLMRKKINRPQFTGSFQIMIFGSGSGFYPGDNTGSMPNPSAETVTIDMREWNEIFEPLLIASDIKNPLNIETPNLSEIFSQHFENTVDKYKSELEKLDNLPDPNTTYCETCKGNFKKDSKGDPTYDTSYKKASDTTTNHGAKPDRKTKTKNE